MWWRPLRALKRGQAPPPHQFHLLIPSMLLEIALASYASEMCIEEFRVSARLNRPAR
jgi:hypothetical protein